MPLLTHIVGTRPNFVKAAPVIRALETVPGIQQRVVHTGQHYDATMSDNIIDDVGMSQPDINLGVGAGTHASQTATAMLRIDKEFHARTPDMVIVYGDVNSTLAAALVATKRHTPVAHVEAGLRSFDRTMPEEINRILVDTMSTMLFTTSPEAEENLAREGVNPSRIHFVGNTMIDTLEWTKEQRRQSSIAQRLELPKGFALVTIHRPGNLEDPERLKQIVEGLRALSGRTTIVFPVHPRGRQVLRDAGLRESKTLLVTNPVGYIDSTWLVEHSEFVVTDSGGLQEESSFLGTACYTVRASTERPITLARGTNFLIRPEDIASIGNGLHRARASLIPGWTGEASSKIATLVRDFVMTPNRGRSHIEQPRRQAHDA